MNKEETPIVHKKLNILVVDDNKDVADTLAMFVAVLGHDVHQVYDGKSALMAAQARRPDYIFLDLDLPELDGFSVARHIAQSGELKDTRFIAITGHADDASIERARAQGFTDYLMKPHIAEELKRVLDRHGHVKQPAAEATDIVH